MKITDIVSLSRSEWERLIDEWIFCERDRRIIKRRLLDGVPFEALASEFDLSVQHVKTLVYRMQKTLLKSIEKST